MPRLLQRPQQPTNPYEHDPLPVDRPAAVYYRQSSEGQIGNISTTLQTVDMVEKLIQQGWVRENIYMIDMDAGVSGQKKIRERAGMSMLYDLIESGQIGLVASHNVDRFFRDLTMIETNIFIDACKRSDVRVMTPMTVYDFAHPVMGQSYIKMFREEAQRSADYLEHQIRGVMVKARHSRSATGMWTGRKIIPGFMMDGRAQLANGAPNPDFRKYRRFDLYADVVECWFRLFREKQGNFKATWYHIEKEGPYLPDIASGLVPEGFQVTTHLRRRSPLTGGLALSEDGLRNLLINVAYIGHWIHMGAIVRFNNHEAIIPHDLFMYAFNRLSKVDFYGEPNPDYVPYRPWIRHNKEAREEAPPTYAYLTYTDDLPDHPHKLLTCVWQAHAQHYKYQLNQYPYRSNVWNIKAQLVDELVDGLLLERLRATTIDDKLWQTALASLDNVGQADIRRVQAAIRQAEQAKDNIIASLGVLTHTDMVKRAEARYAAAEHELLALRAELAHLQSSEHSSRPLIEARPVLEMIISRWDEVPADEKRALFEQFAHYINISKVTRHTKSITVHWRDGTTSSASTTHKSTGYFWADTDIERLKRMIADNVDQVDILRAFPDYKWGSLADRLRYHMGKGWWRTYTGKKKYPTKTKWADTEEARANPQLTPSCASIDRS